MAPPQRRCGSSKPQLLLNEQQDVYVYMCEYIGKYDKEWIYKYIYIYIYINMSLYDIWLPSGSLQRKFLTLCITPQRSGLSVMYI